MKKLSFMIALFLLGGLGYAQRTGAPPATKAARTAYANVINLATETHSYVKFDLDNLSKQEVITTAAIKDNMYAGEFYGGSLYTYDSWTVDSYFQYTVYNATTGELVEGAMCIPLFRGLVRDMAYDYNSDKMYLLMENELYHADKGVVTKQLTITGVDGDLITLAITLDGEAYAITEGANAKLYSIDLTTGAATLVGATGKPAYGQQSMGFDHIDGTLYWSQCDEATSCNFMSVDVTTGAATLLQANTGRMSGFHIPYVANNTRPLPVSNVLMLPGNPNSPADKLTATISWTNPTLDFAMLPLTELTAVEVYDAEGTLLYTVNDPEIGGTDSCKVTVTEKGIYTYKIVAKNSSGEDFTTVTGLIGEADFPKPPRNITMDVDHENKTATLNWEAPLVGVRGGWLDVENITYTVIRTDGDINMQEELPDTVEVATGLDALTLVDNFTKNGIRDSITSRYSYRIAASTAAGTSEFAETPMQTIGKAFTVPFSSSFERFYDKDGKYIGKEYGAWKIADYSDPGDPPAMYPGWEYFYINNPNMMGARTGHGFLWSCSDIKDDYLFSPKIKLEAGKGYEVKFWARSVIEGANERLAIYLAEEQDKETIFGEPIFRHEQMPGDEYVEYSASFVGQEGEFVLAFYSYGPSIILYFDDVSITELPANDAELVEILGNPTPMVGKPFTYKVLVKNSGTNGLFAYTVKLHDNTGAELASSSSGLSLTAGATTWVELTYTPENTDATAVYATITTLMEDAITDNNTTESLAITVAPAADEYLGFVGTEPSNPDGIVPFDQFYPTSTVQMIYYNHELIGQNGLITEVHYLNSFETPGGETGRNYQIWLANTDKESFENNRDWVPDSEFTLVFQGNIFFPQGKNTVSIILDEAFEYTGKNLVVKTVRPNSPPTNPDGYYIWDQFVCSRSPHFAQRTLFYHSQEAFTVEKSGTMMGTYPQMKFKMDMLGGAVSGVVTNPQGSPEPDVTVHIVNQNVTRITDEEGKYSFGLLKPGDYQFKASKHGFIDSDVSSTITVAKGDSKTVDLQLKTLVQYTVSGKITGSDATGGLANAQVKLIGYENYVDTTDASGNFSIPDVYGNNTYSVEVKRLGYFSQSGSVTVNDNTTYNLQLQAKAYPVMNPTAEASGNNALVKWETPIAADYRHYVYDDGSYEDGGIAFNPGERWWAGNRFENNESGLITSVELYGIPNEKNTGKQVAIDIYDAAHQLLGSSAFFQIREEEWMTIPLNVAYTGTFFAMVRWTADEGHSNGLAWDQNGPHAHEGIAMLSNGSIWAEAQLEVRHPAVFLLRANTRVEESDDFSAKVSTDKTWKIGQPANEVALDRITPNQIIPDGTALNRTVSELRPDYTLFPKTPSIFVEPKNKASENKATFTPAPLKYRIYRFLEGVQETQWTSVGEVNAPALSYTDASFSAQPAGAYQYAVKAVYANDNVSEARLTNVLGRDMQSRVEINVTTNSGESSTGTVIALTNSDGKPEHAYSATVSNNQVVFPEVWRGTYQLSATLSENYETFKVSGVNIGADTTLAVILKEIIQKPFNLLVETVDSIDWTLSWNNLWPEQRVAYWQEPNYDKLGATGAAQPGIGFGVLFDLKNYPQAAIDTFEFYNVSMSGHNGNSSYHLYVVNMTDGGEEVFGVPGSTEGNNKWEKVVLNGMELGGKEIAIYVEPLTLAGQYYHPLMASDKLSNNQHSYKFDMNSMMVTLINTGAGDQNYGEMMANLWINVNGQKAKLSNSTKSFTEYAVYLDDVKKAATTELEHEFTDLEAGKTYVAGVEAVYSSGVSELVTITFYTKGGSSIVVTSQDKFTVYPNPVTDILSIETTQTITEINVFDQNGRIVKTQKGNQKTLDLQNLPTGQYVVRIHAGNAIVPVKIIKK